MKKMAFAAFAAASLVGFAAPASATTIVLTGTSNFTAPFQVGAPIYVDLGSGLAGAPYNVPFTALSGPTGGGVFDFTFSLATTLKTFTQLQVNGIEVFGYSLFKGPVGGGSLVTASTTPNAFTNVLSAGDYYLEVTLPAHASISSVNNISGLVSTSAVPEPATWAMMIVGLFGVGAFMRRQRRTLAMASAA
jgi:hypothetical protein